MNVLPIKAWETEPWLLRKHYAKRMPLIEFAFGLYEGADLLGIVTYASPSTPQIANGIWTAEEFRILELNRLVVDTEIKNAASCLVGNSLALLPKPTCVISYADGGQGHIGYIYQAANFLYTGAVTAHDSEYLVHGKKTHPRSLAARGITNPAEWAEKNGIERVRPKPKHRYVFMCGDRKQKRAMIASLAYKQSAYPKGETKRYDAGGKVETQGGLFL